MANEPSPWAARLVLDRIGWPVPKWFHFAEFLRVCAWAASKPTRGNGEA